MVPKSVNGRHFLSCLAAATFVAVIVAICRQVPHVNGTTVALSLVLVILGLATRWGWAEAVVAAITAALGLGYYFAPPYGFGIEAPDHWVALFTFLVTAVATSRLSYGADQRRADAVRQREQMAKLQRLSEALLELDSADSIAQRLSGSLLQTLEAEGVAVYEKASDRILRAGARGGWIDVEMLRESAISGKQFSDAYPEGCVAIHPVREGRDLAGSIGIVGEEASPVLLRAVAEKVGVALARARTSEKEMEAEIGRRSDELKSAIFDALAHEAKGPLSSINIAASALLSERPGDGGQQMEMLRLIVEEVGRLNHWIDETVRMSQSDPGEFNLTKSPHEVSHLISGAIDTLGPRLSGRSIGVEIPESFPMADCDGESVQHVLNLLLDNADKYSPRGAPIRITCALNQDAIVIGVSDAGPGVPLDEQARIFEKHYRGIYQNSGVPGMGLGLASAKYLVESHGGKIGVTNRPGGGATFHFSLPKAAQATR